MTFVALRPAGDLSAGRGAAAFVDPPSNQIQTETIV